jgi:hypothetical protein
MLQAIRCFLSRSRLFTAGARVLASWISIREDDIPQGTHNNLVENDIGKAAVSRKRWLFIAYRQAGWRSAVVYSVLNTARSKGLNPQDLLERYPDTAGRDQDHRNSIKCARSMEVSGHSMAAAVHKRHHSEESACAIRAFISPLTTEQGIHAPSEKLLCC